MSLMPHLPRSIKPLSSSATEACFVGILVMACLASGIGTSPILNGDEARFAQASREMILSDNWIVPTFAGRPRYDKPILIYWATAASFRTFGVTPWAARLPSTVAAALCAALLAWSARRRWSPGSGVAAGLLLAAAPIFFFEGRTCTADALNLLWTLVAMLALEHLMVTNPTRAAVVAFWAGTALAVLTKGPVAPLFILFTLIGIWALNRNWTMWEGLIAVALLIAGSLMLGPILLLFPAAAAGISFLQKPEKWHYLQDFRLQGGLLLFLVITLPWFFAAWHATSGEFFEVAIGRHVLQRGLTALEGHGAFPGFYLVTGLILCFPWLASALAAGIGTWRKRREAPETLFLMAWALGPLVALELIQTKLVHYWLPSYPALILLAVGWLWTRAPHRVHGGLVALHIAGGCLLAAIPLIPAFIFDLTSLQKPAIMLSGLLAATTILSSLRLRSRPIAALAISTAGTLAFLTLLCGPFLSAFSPSFLGTRTADAAENHLKWGNQVALYGLRDEEILFSLPPETRVFRTPVELPITEDLLFIAREKDLVRDLSGSARAHVEVIERIEGLDLGHGRTAATVFFHLREEP